MPKPLQTSHFKPGAEDARPLDTAAGIIREKPGKKTEEIKMTNYNELIQKAIELIDNDDDLFCELVDELDSWNGFADGYRCFDMGELDDFYCDAPASKLINDITEDFRLCDDYFYFSTWGLESTSDKAGLYRSNTDAGEILDNVIDDRAHLYIRGELVDLLDEIEEAREEATA